MTFLFSNTNGFIPLMFFLCKVATDTEALHVIIHIFHKTFSQPAPRERPSNWKSKLMFNQILKTYTLNTFNLHSHNFVIDSNE